MVEPGRVDVAVELAADAVQDIEVEGGGDALGIIVGGMQDGRVLHQVDANQQAAGSKPVAAAALQQAGRCLEKTERLCRGEVADGRAGKETGTALRTLGRCRDRKSVV